MFSTLIKKYIRVLHLRLNISTTVLHHYLRPYNFRFEVFLTGLRDQKLSINAMLAIYGLVTTNLLNVSNIYNLIF